MFKEWINKLQRKVKSQQLKCCKKSELWEDRECY